MAGRGAWRLTSSGSDGFQKRSRTTMAAAPTSDAMMSVSSTET
jgi:hypothetical protein